MKCPYTKCPFRKGRSKNRCLTLIAYESGMINLEEALERKREQYRRHMWTDYIRLNIYREVVDYYRRYYGKIDENRKTASGIASRIAKMYYRGVELWHLVIEESKNLGIPPELVYRIYKCIKPFYRGTDSEFLRIEGELLKAIERREEILKGRSNGECLLRECERVRRELEKSIRSYGVTIGDLIGISRRQ
ncbi:MAG: hypothetical protein DRJ49_04435 [Thermoprotei archaeon]|nr:MAG: hypothetical protein DRJ49_04435 [Thermoprotei archaeon]